MDALTPWPNIQSIPTPVLYQRLFSAMPFPPVITARQIVVSKGGNDSTGDGTPINPFLTVPKANAVIVANADNTESAPYAVLVQPGTYNEDFNLLPWVWYCGQGVMGGPTGDPALFHTASVGGTVWLNGMIDFDASWGNANFQRGGIAGLYIGLDNVMHAPAGSDGMVFDVFNCGVHSFQIFFRDLHSCFNMMNGFINDPSVQNGYSTFFNVSVPISLTVTGDNFSGLTQMDLIGCRIKNLVAQQTGGGTVQVNAYACAVENSAINSNTPGFGANVTFDVVSFPRTGAPILTGADASFDFFSNARALNYTAGNSANWSGSSPHQVQDALDRIAAKITPIP